MHLRTQRSIDNYVGRLAIALLRPITVLLGVILRRDHRLTVGDEVVWMKLLGGGSLLLAMPMLLGFRRVHPNTRMVLITTRAVKPFAELMGVFDEYRVIDLRNAGTMATSSLKVLMQTLRADCIVDLEVHSRLTTVFATLTLARNRVSFWLEDIFWRRGLASHLVFFNRASGSYHFYDRIADLFEATVADRDACRTALLQTAGLGHAPPRREEMVALGFACSDLGQERMLSPEQWVEVFRSNMKARFQTFVLLGGPADSARADSII